MSAPQPDDEPPQMTDIDIGAGTGEIVGAIDNNHARARGLVGSVATIGVQYYDREYQQAHPGASWRFRIVAFTRGDRQAQDRFWFWDHTVTEADGGRNLNPVTTAALQSFGNPLPAVRRSARAARRRLISTNEAAAEGKDVNDEGSGESKGGEGDGGADGDLDTDEESVADDTEDEEADIVYLDGSDEDVLVEESEWSQDYKVRTNFAYSGPQEVRGPQHLAV